MKTVLKINSHFQSGFTLIEILIAMVILSVGVLGLAGLQGMSIRSSDTAYMRTAATAQIYDFAERMRSNVEGYELSGNGGDDAYAQRSGIPTYTSCNIVTSVPGGGCNPTQLAIRDVAMWNIENARVLPNGQGIVCRAGQSFIITVSWDQDGIGSGFVVDTFGFPLCAPLTPNTLKCMQYRMEP